MLSLAFWPHGRFGDDGQWILVILTGLPEQMATDDVQALLQQIWSLSEVWPLETKVRNIGHPGGPEIEFVYAEALWAIRLCATLRHSRLYFSTEDETVTWFGEFSATLTTAELGEWQLEGQGKRKHSELYETRPRHSGLTCKKSRER